MRSEREGRIGRGGGEAVAIARAAHAVVGVRAGRATAVEALRGAVVAHSVDVRVMSEQMGLLFVASEDEHGVAYSSPLMSGV